MTPLTKYFNSIKVGSKIIDVWYSRKDYKDCWGIGIVKSFNEKKTKITVEFPNALKDENKIAIYDRTHIRNFTKKFDCRTKFIKENEELYV